MFPRLGLGTLGLLPCVLACKLPSSSIEPANRSRAGEPSGRSVETSKPSPVAVRNGATLLIDAGAEPHNRLRYHPRVGAVVHWELDVMVKNSWVFASEPMEQQLRVLFDLQTEVVSVDEAAAKVEYRTTFVNTQFWSSVDDPAEIEVARANYADLVSWTRTTARGESLEYGYTRHGDAIDPSLHDTLENPARAMVVLPEEPIGIGARWYAYTELKSVGVSIQQTSEHLLVGRDGDRLEIATTIKQEPLMWTIAMAAPDGMPLQLLRFAAVGEGTANLDLGMPVPVESRTMVKLDMEASMYESSTEPHLTLEMMMRADASRRR